MILLNVLLDEPIVCASQRWPRVLHAVRGDEIVRAWPNGTVTSACGKPRLRLFAHDDVALPWPPKIRGLAPRFERCRDCWELAGRRRPRCWFKERVA